MRLLALCLLAIFGYIASSSVISGRLDISKRAINSHYERDVNSITLEKRKGGGGGKGGGSSSSGGGTSRGGSGVTPSYGGGRYYGGGASVPYAAGARSSRGLAPVGLLGVGALAFFPGLWLYGAYLYPYSSPYSFHNRTSNNNETKPVECLCQEYSVCGCDENSDSTYLDSVIGDGNTTSFNQSLVRVADVNGTSTIVLNGTLPNGTTANFATSIRGHSSLGLVMIASSFACAFLLI
ncbi:hypothetical protein BT63DRAFT_286139 [Microthyrium microscopicum]|uniref:DUF7732 domain-containing protein n=1 Tax=Microthyrium microscopicum TaxID=703497 RepID=A0A6A6UD20_9PEZI|nr:hypothetical protein BT63DRAFT_286139 [Microthyrium microscopicum]